MIGQLKDLLKKQKGKIKRWGCVGFECPLVPGTNGCPLVPGGNFTRYQRLLSAKNGGVWDSNPSRSAQINLRYH